ncbi:MAG: SUMF1/EgtB/PvdO family nonheme iron enzyme [Rhodospirillales bacterium]|jgi:formylglycine-generating enzyme required for sulfatase activity|nr:SUMF1/EgtB/PvdO family nonheme iron enzyme [Rhodospirillales bacterium]
MVEINESRTWRRIAANAILCSGVLFSVAAIAADDPEPGKSFRDCALCPEMMVVGAGSFIMGSDERHANERPAHEVSIAKPFAIGKYEITFDEWQAYLDDGGCSTRPDDHKWGRERRPVMNVTHAEAVGYAAWLALKIGKVYRLPSEAEWEYAARAGTETAFWWGDEAGVNRANCRDCGSEWSKKSSGPVGSFAPNPWDLFDTSGNVWEWVADCWNPTHDGAPQDGSVRLDGECRNRVMRDGSWYYFSKNARSAWRWKNDARVKSYGIGLRVLRELD